MSDRYLAFAGTPVGSFLTARLGLPRPRPLVRFSPDEPLVTGEVLWGGSSRLEAAATEVTRSRTTDEPLAALVFDASDLSSSDQLVQLHEFFNPVGRALRPNGRVIVFGRPPAEAATASARIAQRALEGFTRSLAKEIGRSSTAQLVYVAAGAEDRIGSTLAFLLSKKSAYVSGQVINISSALAATPDGAQPRVALVTGASRGIGEAIARTLHRDGMSVIGVDVPAAASSLQELMDELGGSRLALDITASDAPARIARHVSEHYGGLDVVVHNAGITRDKKLVNMATDRWTSVIDVNLGAPERITAALLDGGVIRPNGRIIGVSSIAGIAGNAGQTNYATSKAGVIGLVDAFAVTAAERQVTVNAVAPGFIETQMTESIPLALREAGRRMNSLSQGGLPVDVAETVAWFADPASSGVTGNVVRVCGQSLLGA